MTDRYYDQQTAHLVPASPGVYQWFDQQKSLLYIGKAKNLRTRTSQYFKDGAHKPEMAKLLRFLQVTETKTEHDALLLEQQLIKQLAPPFNVRLKDGRGYPYLCLTTLDDWPRLELRYHITDNNLYLGPFTEPKQVRQLLAVLQDIYPLRRCATVPAKKCLYYDIGKCLGPCIKNVASAYTEHVQDLRNLFNGQTSTVKEHLSQQITKAADKQEFELAAKYRDLHKSLQQLLANQHVSIEGSDSADVWAYAITGNSCMATLLPVRDGVMFPAQSFSWHTPTNTTFLEALSNFYTNRPLPKQLLLSDNVTREESRDLLLLRPSLVISKPIRGAKKRWLSLAELNLKTFQHKQEQTAAIAAKELQEVCQLSRLPLHIEGFDISHQSGKHTRGARVVFRDGLPDKSSYRLYRSAPQTGSKIDDYQSISLTIKAAYPQGHPLPDLILIDGGIGQLRAANLALQDLGHTDVNIVSLAKREELIMLMSGRSVKLTGHSAGLQLLQRVRDEAHRFSITSTRKKATQSVTHSPLLNIPGVGPKKRQLLIRSFAGLDGVKSASITDLAAVPGISLTQAKLIFNALQKDS